MSYSPKGGQLWLKVYFTIWTFFLLGDPVCNVVKLTKTVFYMGEMNHYFVVIYVFVGANSPNYGKNEEDENMIIKGNITVKY